jgi:glucokinase
MNILAIDLGGTRLRAALYDENYQQLARAETQTHSHEGLDPVLSRVLAIARKVAGDTPIDLIGMSTPGPMDAEHGVILHSFALPGWQDVPLAQIVSDAFGGVPTYADNDGNVGPLAEYHLGAGKGADPMIYMTVSTWIGGGVVIDGKLFKGWSGHAAEPGHMQFTDDEGQVRRLEELASGTAIGWLGARRLKTWHGDSLLRAAPEISGAVVGAAAAQGDALALAVVREAGHYLGLGVVNLLHLFSPEAIVFGGSVTKLGDLLFVPVWETIRERVLDVSFLPPNLIRMAQVGDDVCLVGAALNAMNRQRGAG